jgi:hypothetical protein
MKILISMRPSSSIWISEVTLGSTAPRIALTPAKSRFLALAEKYLIAHDWLTRTVAGHLRHVVVVFGNADHQSGALAEQSDELLQFAEHG